MWVWLGVGVAAYAALMAVVVVILRAAKTRNAAERAADAADTLPPAAAPGSTPGIDTAAAGADGLRDRTAAGDRPVDRDQASQGGQGGHGHRAADVPPAEVRGGPAPAIPATAPEPGTAAITPNQPDTADAGRPAPGTAAAQAPAEPRPEEHPAR
ncbi:hypothetical protein LO772_28810 [Yinghuangia sp. ASG 101]|uniref:hypothetical protein n=1 Tax=Yinghuangia sp. ASG 101 TaxID=2896848 RepID=UPI001E351EEA|nr:hypothetical protein [Yinghuangia sp. ASG 101]UGQ10782.1 hypothetical protein LO772_28810 [Yinghuangia sp. ASG 101]